MQPRDYQQDAVTATLDKFERNQTLVGVMATGMGKTSTAGFIANSYKDKGRILWLTHEGQLLKQSQRTMETITGLPSQVEKAGMWADGRSFGQGLLFSTIQTMIAGRNGGRMTRFNPNDFAYVVVDEGHHSRAQSWMRVIRYFQQNADMKMLLLTATPNRSDELALGAVAQDVAFEHDLRYGIDHGWLVGIESTPCYVHSLDLSDVSAPAGELNGAELSRKLEEDRVVLEMARPVMEKCGDEKTLVFTQTVDQAMKFAALLNYHKPGSAEYVCGKTPEEYRTEMFERYARSKFQYLVNVGITVEGFDEPDIRWIVMGRPHLSLLPYAQKLGRGTRPLRSLNIDALPDEDSRIKAISESPKPKIKILDFYAEAGGHRLIHVADVLGGRYEEDVIKLANELVEREDKPADIPTALVRAEREIERRRKEKESLQKCLHTYAQVHSKYIYGESRDPFEAFDLIPCRIPSWHKSRGATDAQREYIKGQGFNVDDDLNFTHAHQIIEEIQRHPSQKQAKQLRRCGFPINVTRKQASVFMDAIVKNRWRPLPKGQRQALIDSVLSMDAKAKTG